MSNSGTVWTAGDQLPSEKMSYVLIVVAFLFVGAGVLQFNYALASIGIVVGISSAILRVMVSRRRYRAAMSQADIQIPIPELKPLMFSRMAFLTLVPVAVAGFFLWSYIEENVGLKSEVSELAANLKRVEGQNSQFVALGEQREQKIAALNTEIGRLQKLAALPTKREAEEPIKWKIQSAFVSGSMYFDLLEKFADRIDKMSGGRLKTDVLPAGAVVKSFEILDAVDKGTVEAGYSSTQFWSGKHPAAYLFSNQPTIGGMDQFGFLAWYYEGDGYKLYDELYRDHLKANVKGFIIGASGGQPLGGFTKPIANLEDLKGLKYRSIPGPASELFKEMGISVVNLRGGEIVPALGRGVIEASEWINPKEHIKLGWPQFGKHYYLQGFHKASELGEIIINKDFWNKLAPDLQEIIKGAARASVAEDIAANIYRNAVALIELQSKYGVKIHDTPQELYTEFLRASDKVVARNSEKNDFFKKVLESQKAFAATVVPYWTKILGMYTYLGEAALKK